MTPKFTPGPWIIQPDNESDYRVLVTDSSTESIIMAEGFMRDNPRHMADARLIASAPDLYAALEALLKDYGNLLRAYSDELADDGIAEAPEDDSASVARAALAKARGMKGGE